MTADHKHGLKAMFKKDSPHEHHGLGKLLHKHDKPAADKPRTSPSSDIEKMTKTPSFLSLRRHNASASIRADKQEPKKLSKAETMLHLQQLNNKNHRHYAAQEARKPPSHSLHDSAPSTTHQAHDKIVYNPFGLNKELGDGPKDPSFYLNGDAERVLANPVHDPNDYLPPEFRQRHVNLLDDFEIDVGSKKLGSGGSSEVRIVNAVHSKKKLYALKKFTMLHKETDEEFYHRASKEFILSKRAISRHVVDVLAIVRIQSQNNLTRGWGFVLEFCEGGDLFGLICRPGWKKSPLAERFCMFKQVAYGVKFLHDHDIVHRDLKPENVLIDKNGMCKLCDFGISEYGHETPGDFTSPVRMFHSFVGSPPFQPPEVVLLKDKSQSENKNFPYDAFKMDCWGLGMVMFCIVYGGIPFQSATPADHAFRDYKFNHHRYASSNPVFKNSWRCCREFNKGPGSEFKWAAQFGSTGASRVAWKLCDPAPEHRYSIDDLFEDSWFRTAEMCLYEDPDQEVNPVLYPNASVVSSGNNSRIASRNNTFNKTSSHHHEHSAEMGQIKSMLDVTEGADNSSVKSASSLTAGPLDLNIKEECDCECTEPEPKGPEVPKKVKSMLDITEESPKKEQRPLDALKEDDVVQVAQTIKPATSSSSASSASSGAASSFSSKAGSCSCNCHSEVASLKSSRIHASQNSSVRPRATSMPTRPPRADSFSRPPSRSGSQTFAFEEFVPSKVAEVHLDSSGICDLGYRIKKHHHTEVSNQQTSAGPKRR